MPLDPLGRLVQDELKLPKSHCVAGDDEDDELDEVLDAAAEHATMTGLAPLWAVTLLAGVNDTDAHASALADRVLAFRQRTGRSPRLSIIPYNAIGTAEDGRVDPFVRAGDDREVAFRDVLRARGVFTHKRYSGGGDVDAACGQLAARG
jgi:23S rRNA (adenine2503-C2)-methyltransferase